MDVNTGGSQEYQGMDEDDVFYAVIRRQILLLMADDDEDRPERAHRQGSNRIVGGVSSGVQAPRSYFTWEKTEKSNSVPTWLVNLWKNGNGTGVSVPYIAETRRKRPGRMNNERRRIYKPVHSNHP
ncbi:hypothetical protein SLEP1_g51173 [Rubroshorea leprosula]|uniref:Uncharacterized protein n=1 Tax=Rubroshorea leprosula TaxID=152421 RepID=A0AAV5M2F1_9ROSI|nr:hypothetical protein SLEP1_g51173 [Rubroshorea leprosula]